LENSQVKYLAFPLAPLFSVQAKANEITTPTQSNITKTARMRLPPQPKTIGEIGGVKNNPRFRFFEEFDFFFQAGELPSTNHEEKIRLIFVGFAEEN